MVMDNSTSEDPLAKMHIVSAGRWRGSSVGPVGGVLIAGVEGRSRVESSLRVGGRRIHVAGRWEGSSLRVGGAPHSGSVGGRNPHCGSVAGVLIAGR